MFKSTTDTPIIESNIDMNQLIKIDDSSVKSKAAHRRILNVFSRSSNKSKIVDFKNMDLGDDSRNAVLLCAILDSEKTNRRTLFNHAKQLFQGNYVTISSGLLLTSAIILYILGIIFLPVIAGIGQAIFVTALFFYLSLKRDRKQRIQSSTRLRNIRQRKVQPKNEMPITVLNEE